MQRQLRPHMVIKISRVTAIKIECLVAQLIEDERKNGTIRRQEMEVKKAKVEHIESVIVRW